MKAVVCGLCLVLLGCAVAHFSAPADRDAALTTLLKALGLTRADLTIRSDTLDDPDRFAVTRSLLRRPLDYGRVAGQFRGETARAVLAATARAVGLADTSAAARSEAFALPEGIPPALGKLIAALGACRGEMDAAFAGLRPEERARLGDLIALVDPDTLLAEPEADALIALGRRVRRDALYRAGAHVLRAVDAFLAEKGDLPPMQIQTPIGLVVVGTPGDDVYDRPAALIVDPGGNDRYEGVAGVASAGLPVSVCIDMAGRDTYAVAQGVGRAGIGVVVDLAGNDDYVCVQPGQGCGVAGVGVVDDRGGDDVYRGEIGCQGCGVYGIGLLFDGAGDDHYTGAFLAQGAAGPGGVGALCDRSGNDVYVAGGRVRDFREDGQYFQSMAQGFSLGVRPLTSGGVGVLVDAAGDDVYRADYFAQGAAFWGGTGFLIDRMGADRYTARRYAQGAGVHLAVGVLLDAAGDDAYALWGVGQGCGHDLAVGVLADRSGDDAYQASWLAQGAGNANGIGVLDDGAGADRYAVSAKNAQGYGEPFRGYGSIGLLIDRGGTDAYDGPGADGQVWTGGHYGGGIDWPLGEKR